MKITYWCIGLKTANALYMCAKPKPKVISSSSSYDGQLLTYKKTRRSTLFLFTAAEHMCAVIDFKLCAQVCSHRNGIIISYCTKCMSNRLISTLRVERKRLHLRVHQVS